MTSRFHFPRKVIKAPSAANAQTIVRAALVGSVPGLAPVPVPAPTETVVLSVTEALVLADPPSPPAVELDESEIVKVDEVLPVEPETVEEPVQEPVQEPVPAVDPVETTSEDAVAEAAPESVHWDPSMKKADLLAAATALGLTLEATATKAEIVAALKGQTATA